RFRGRYVTFVRDPVDRVESFFRHYAREGDYRLAIANGLTLVDFLQIEERQVSLQVSNHMTQLLSGRDDLGGRRGRGALDEAWSNLETYFSFIGVSENMEESTSRLGEVLGWSTPINVPRLNVDEHRDSFDIDEKTRAEIARVNELDIELYQRVLHNATLARVIEPRRSVP
ncbi:MAG TPA: sulfotransferase family 2 domain-containing protein, partial [Acidimicrobiales bacterium]|nr:sulfotransferase family 2 domain-containing protein [Acidimicrobiales bacterium]